MWDGETNWLSLMWDYVQLLPSGGCGVNGKEGQAICATCNQWLRIVLVFDGTNCERGQHLFELGLDGIGAYCMR